MKQHFFKKLLVSLGIIFNFVLVSCANEDGSSSHDPVLAAYQLIDEQRTDEAIALLEGELKKEPEKYELKVALARRKNPLSGLARK